MKTKLMLIWVSIFVLCGSLLAETPKPVPGVGLTIYNDDFAVVKERRLMDFEKGTNKVRFTDVASAIDPTSVNFKCISNPDAVKILEQNYEFDLVNTASLLKRYIDRNVSISLKGSGADHGDVFNGILSASVGNDLILKTDSGRMVVINRDSVEKINLARMPEDLVTKPTLVWLASAQQKGSQLCQVTYTTNAIGWKADYSAVLNQNEDKLDLTGWVTVNNKSGGAYKNATIKLIAGDVRRLQQPSPMPRRSMSKMYAAPMEADAGFAEKPFMEYHLYTLGRKSTINNNQVKQIELIDPAQNVPVKKLFVYEWQKKSDKVQVKLEFENKKEYDLGIALPKGKVRVFKKDPADGTLEFVGEDLIDHTANKEKLSLYIGDAFDVVPEHKTKDTKRSRRKFTETHEIELRNRKNQPVTVYVDEKFPDHVNWQVSSDSKYEKRDSRTARFQITVPADSTKTVEYTVVYTW